MTYEEAVKYFIVGNYYYTQYKNGSQDASYHLYRVSRIEDGMVIFDWFSTTQNNWVLGDEMTSFKHEGEESSERKSPVKEMKRKKNYIAHLLGHGWGK